MGRVFQIVPCSEEKKITFTLDMLKGPAVRWWDSASTLMTSQWAPRDWENFKTTFLDKYFPSSLKTQKEFEFQQLRQGNMSVTKYAEKFENMVVYSSNAMYSPDEKKKVDQVILGLKSEIAQSVS